MAPIALSRNTGPYCYFTYFPWAIKRFAIGFHCLSQLWQPSCSVDISMWSKVLTNSSKCKARPLPSWIIAFYRSLLCLCLRFIVRSVWMILWWLSSEYLPHPAMDWFEDCCSKRLMRSFILGAKKPFLCTLYCLRPLILSNALLYLQLTRHFLFCRKFV